MYTHAMSKWSLAGGRVGAAVFVLLIPRLRRLARARLRNERPGHTLQVSALVNKVYESLNLRVLSMADPEHLFRICARIMHRCLIDHGRARNARLAREAAVASRHAVASVPNETHLSLRFGLDELGRTDPLAAQTLKLHSMHGWTVAEISRLQARQEWRVRKDYEFALEWMRSYLSGSVAA